MALTYGSYFITPVILATMVSNYLAPILRLRWPELAH